MILKRPDKSFANCLTFSPGIFANVHRPVVSKPDRNIKMNAEAGREVTVFTEAIKVPVRDRAAFLKKACRGDINLRRKVEALLKAHDRIGNFLEEPPSNE